MYDQLAHAGDEHLDPDTVDGFDQKQGSPDPREDIETLIRHGLNASSTVVDMGVGTGQFALAAARYFARIIAVDPSELMLIALRAKAHDLNLRNIENVQAGFLSYDHTGSPAAALLSRHTLHHLPHFWKVIALTRMAMLLQSQGILRIRDLIYDFAASDAESVFDEWLAGAGDDPDHGYTAGDYAHPIRTEHSTFRPHFELALAEAGFDIVDCGFQGRFFGAYTCVKR